MPLWTESGASLEQHSRMVVVGHRGCGMNTQEEKVEEGEIIPSILENTIASFNAAATSGVDFVEFDVQVTKDGHPVIFHDDQIMFAHDDDEKEQDSANICSRYIREVTVDEFLSIGCHSNLHHNMLEKCTTLYRKSKDGSIRPWRASIQDSLCTLEEAFLEVNPCVGFNIEVKFNDNERLPLCEIRHAINQILGVVKDFSMFNRELFFSTFHPDAAHILREQQSIYPVFFLTNGGTKLYDDPRRNSIQEAIEVCRTGGLQGIVCEVKAILEAPEAVKLIKKAGLALLTYGELNNRGDAIRKQDELGVDGVIVDHVAEIVHECFSINHLTELTIQMDQRTLLLPETNV